MRLGSRLLYGLGVPLTAMKPLFRNFRGNWGSYRPFFQPWRENALFERFLGKTEGLRLYSDETFFHVYQFARLCLPIAGGFWECGVYRGATSTLLAELITSVNADTQLHLFDTFSGIPESSDVDKYKEHDLGDTSLERVQERLKGYSFTHFHPGLIPDTFAGLEGRTIAFAHVDVDQMQSTSDCLRFIYPRLAPGGVIVVDDYGRPGTYGCRVAVDEFMAEIGSSTLVLNTGQGVILKR